MTFPIAPQVAAGFPAAFGYRFPAEWDPHYATWLSRPHKEESWPGKLDTVYPIFSRFVAELAKGEYVHINVNDPETQALAAEQLRSAGADMSKVRFAATTALPFW